MNQLSGPLSNDLVRKSISEHLSFLNAQISDIGKQIDDLIDKHMKSREQRDLIKSIPGLGHRSATSITAEFQN
jgi:transposase